MKRNSSNFFHSIIVAGLWSAMTAFGQTNTTGTNWVVTITAPDPGASEAGDPGLFRVARGTNTTGNLLVFLSITGTALNGADYQAISNRVLIADGATSATFAVTPIDDAIPEPTESVTARVILAPTGFFPYRIGSPNTATVNITDNDGFVPSNQPPVVNIVQPTNNALFLAPANISIEAIAQDSDGFVTSVEFFANNQSLGFGTTPNPANTSSNFYSLTWSNVPPGAYDLTAKATDDGGAMRISSPVHIVVGTNLPPATNVPPIVNIVRPTNNAVFLAPTNIALRAFARDFDGLVTSVEFFANNQSLGFGTTTNSSGTASNFFLTWSNVQAGVYDLTAKATDDDGAMRISLPVHIFVGTNPPPPTNFLPLVNILQPSNNAAFLAPANISIRAVAWDPDGVVTSVEFFANNLSIGFGSNINPDGTVGTNYFLTWNNVGAGSYDLTAKATDNFGAMAFSAPVHVSVFSTNAPPPPPTNQLALVNISATDPTASEGLVMWCSNTVLGLNWWCATNGILRTNWPCPSGTNTATFTVRRSGGTNHSLRVYYSIGGSASNGVDYHGLSGVVTIPAGARGARIVVTPVDDMLREGIETVVLRLRLPPLPLDPVDTPYAIGQPSSAAAYITDNDRPPPPCGRLADGTVHLCSPFTNHCFRVERSTNLVHWEGICTNRVADGAARHLDPDATNCLRQFIRFIPVPCPPDGQ